ncbi:hypothetical protein [Streptomyces thinghirensis]|uniref:hypothetical protein n=1 Tax=Streptomyces thinghirensis TaxID=551547 RepID=UPI0031EA4DA7
MTSASRSPGQEGLSGAPAFRTEREILVNGQRPSTACQAVEEDNRSILKPAIAAQVPSAVFGVTGFVEPIDA